MTLEMNIHLSNGSRIFSTLPELDRIPVKAVREAVEKVATRVTAYREADARARMAFHSVRTTKAATEAEANVAAESGERVESKKLAKRIRAAEEDLEAAYVEVRACERAAAKAHGEMVEIIKKHTPAWRDAALKKADSALLKMTTARRQVEIAAAELAEPLGVLALLGRLPEDNLPVMTAPGKSALYVSLATENLTMAIGEAVETFDVFKGAEVVTPDVVVPVPEHETVDEFAIVAGADDE